jgi:probable HAF family extracellular repeat protein
MNDAGLVAGVSTNGSGFQHGFLWNGGMMVDLGTLGGGSSAAYDVNAAGDVVGFSYTGAGVSSAFLFRNGFLLDLNLLIPAASGWLLEEAYAINDSGRIAGVGMFNGERRGFLLDPLGERVGNQETTAAIPEPGTFGMVVGAALLLAGSRFLRRAR